MKFTVFFAIAAASLLAVWMLRVQGSTPPATRPAQRLAEGLGTGSQLKQADFAAGCFWGVEASFRAVKGVVSTAVGFAGGKTKNPSYRQVCTDSTGHAETVQVTYDPAQVSYAELLDVFWSSHDPTTLDRQGPDIGTQYRSVIFYHDAEQEKLARASLKEVQDSGVFKGRIVTEIVPANSFYRAEEYHQQYFEKQGMAGSCHVGVAHVHTKLADQGMQERLVAATRPAKCSVDGADSACGTSHWKGLTDAELRAKLTPEQYDIARKAGTEVAFTGKYWNEHRAGTYRCAVCGQDLFSSKTKFDSGTGWPSFYAPIDKNAVAEKTDGSLFGEERTEVLCSRCQSHLGHVFDDGPRPTGLRYCMNSAVLELVPEGTEKSANTAAQTPVSNVLEKSASAK